ncbi:hypothetical protein CI109_105505 [Kwoniella shandongensis]|uniref:Uncharacterized protein n=1 Tax=Kwoniella shandongensis TaxID=1734106 RepID=A0A5M6C2W0_9TREE|nr:uncharacterized protein CI109_002226 [Kwoniella shandongensis]KAA5529333.1 hypothetical protein CI109_002226 [Kwoniella shandongensis]
MRAVWTLLAILPLLGGTALAIPACQVPTSASVSASAAAAIATDGTGGDSTTGSATSSLASITSSLSASAVTEGASDIGANQLASTGGVDDLSSTMLATDTATSSDATAAATPDTGIVASDTSIAAGASSSASDGASSDAAASNTSPTAVGVADADASASTSSVVVSAGESSAGASSIVSDDDAVTASTASATDAGAGASVVPNASTSDAGVSASASASFDGENSADASASASPNGSTSASANSSSSTTKVASSSPGQVLLSDPSSCKCGYNITSLDNYYLPYKFSFAFSTETDRVLSSPSDLSDKGWIVNDGQHAGGAGDDGAQCWGDYKNLKIDKGDLVLTVPGGQTLGPEMKCAEIAFNETVTGGVFQTEAQLSAVEGVCEAMWLNHSIATQYADELDIEILSSQIDTIYNSNWPPNGDPNNPTALSSISATAQFPQGLDPTKSYNNYTIAWLQQDQKVTTNRYLNGQTLATPVGNEAIHPQIMTINLWSNGGSGWTKGPPAQDAEMRVKSVLFYYKTDKVSKMEDLSQDCKVSDVCQV